MRITLDIASETAETIHAKSKWSEIFKLLKRKNSNLKFCFQQNYPSKVKESILMILVCQDWLTTCSKCTTLVRDVVNGGGYACYG